MTTTCARRDDAPASTGATVQTNIFHPHRTPAIRLSVSLKRLLVEQFTPDALRQIAASMDDERPRMVARRRLSEASVEALAEMICAGHVATIGWWKRNAA